MLHNKSKFYYKTLPPPNPQIKFQEDVCARYIEWHILYPLPPHCLKFMMLLHMYNKCLRW